jgi:outer membrane protein
MRGGSFCTGAAAAVVLLLSCAGAGGTEVYESPLSLADCIAVAIENSPDLAQTKEDLRLDQADFVSSFSALLPSAYASSGYTRSGPSFRISATGVMEEVTTETYSTRFSLSQPLLDLPGWTGIFSAGAAVTAGRASLREMENAVVLAVTEGYYGLLKAIALEDVALLALERSEGNLAHAEALYELGAASKADYLSIKVEKTQAEVDLITARGAVDLARASLVRAMGIPFDRPVEIEEVPGIVQREVPVLAALKDLAFERRPEVANVDAALHQANLNVFSARTTYLPTLLVTADYSYSGEEFPDDATTWDANDSWSIGIRAELPLFDGLRRESALSRAATQRALLGQEKRRRVLAIEYEVEAAYLAVQEATKRLDVVELAREEAGENYRMAEERYRLGAAAPLELVTAQLALNRAESSEVEAVYDRRLAVARLESAVGGPLP